MQPRSTSMVALAALVISTSVAIGGGAWRVAWAHSFEPALLDLRERSDGIFDVVWKPPLRAPVVGGAPEPRPVLPDWCTAIATESAARADERRAPAADEAPAMASEPQLWRVDCRPAGLRGAPLAASGLEVGRTDVLVRIHWRDGSLFTGMLLPDRAAMEIPGVASGAPVSEIFSRYLRLGIEHIWTGVDHLLFVLGLLLLIDGWRPLVKTITAFTVAHTFTLALAATGVVHVPAAPVEAAIALSILLVALEAARGELRHGTTGASLAHDTATLAQHSPWLVALLFGLVHGLGFAGALAEVGLPADQVPLALLSFNLGVEVGQLAFVALALAPLRALQRGPRWLRLAPSYAIGALAVAWTLERVEQMWRAAP